MSQILSPVRDGKILALRLAGKHFKQNAKGLYAYRFISSILLVKATYFRLLPFISNVLIKSRKRTLEEKSPRRHFTVCVLSKMRISFYTPAPSVCHILNIFCLLDFILYENLSSIKFIRTWILKLLYLNANSISIADLYCHARVKIAKCSVMGIFPNFLLYYD